MGWERAQTWATIAAVVMLLMTGTAVADSSQKVQSWPQPEFRFDPTSDRVTVALPLQDAQGDYIPDARRDNFVVYEDGVRQRNVQVDIQRAPVTLGILLEHGGRYQTLNEAINGAVSSSSRMLLDHVLPEDTLSVWDYGDRLETITGFEQGRAVLQEALQKMKAPSLSESNLYDALSGALTDLEKVSGRKGLLLISSGVDTFSNSSLPELLQRVRDAAVPIYVINLHQLLQQDVALRPDDSPYGRLNWKRANSALASIAKVSGGRMYTPASTLELPALYDDLMESLRARYVISYSPATAHVANTPREVRVEVVDPRTGAPLMLADTKGRPVHAAVTVAGSYRPDRAPASATG